MLLVICVSNELLVLCVATVNPPVSPSTALTINPIEASSVPPCKRDADGMPDLGSYLEQTTSVYKVSEGFSLAHEGRSLGGLEKVIWDTGSEINLIPESFAKAANIRYDAAHGPTVGGSAGRDSRTLGKVIGPVQSVLNGGTAFEAITHSPAAVTLFVMSGV